MEEEQEPQKSTSQFNQDVIYPMDNFNIMECKSNR